MQRRPQSARNDKQIAENLLRFTRASFNGYEVSAGSVSPYHTTISRAAHCELPRRRKSDRLSHLPIFRERRQRRLNQRQCRTAGGTWKRSSTYDTERVIPVTHSVEVLGHQCVVCENEFDNDRRVPWGCFCEETQDYAHYMCAVCYDQTMREALNQDMTYFPCPICGDLWGCEIPRRIVGTETEQHLYNRLMKGLKQMTFNDPSNPNFKSNLEEAKRLTKMLTDLGNLGQREWVDAANKQIQLCNNMLEYRPGGQGYVHAREHFGAMFD